MTSFLFKMGKVIPKRKQWSAVQPRGPKRVKVEVKSTQTEESECLTDGITTEAYELMVRGEILYPCSTNRSVSPLKLWSFYSCLA